ncbi:MAG: HAMP domain-containing histidine kinase [Anaerolineaceae bacterium]|nr:HAMP domain-containing histidine kinase [Anaerolineaceae bacterium]
MNRLWLRLALSFLIVTWLVVGVVALLISASVQSNFRDYVTKTNIARFGQDLVTQLEAYYAVNNTWDGVGDLLPERGGGSGAGSGNEGRGAQLFIADANGIVVAATQSDWVGQPVAALGTTRTIDLHDSNEQRVGILGEQTPGSLAINEAEQQFSQETSSGLLLTALLGGVAAFLLGILVSYNLTRPLQRLTDAVSAWTVHDLGQQVSVSGTDEMRQMAKAFNTLSGRLGEGETARRQMAADIAHELRTPVTVMRGHLEAMMDGIYPLDTAHLGVAYDQVLHLNRLVEDLRLLTLAEAGHLPLNQARLKPETLIQQAAERFEPLAQDAAITLTIETPGTLPEIHADAHRLLQVFDNLLTNALRHTPEHGRIAIRATQTAETVKISVFNSGQPIPPEQAARLFDQFWRADEARKRDAGGSGLGLAISRQLVRLHGGEMVCEPVPDGACFTFTLPVGK